MWRVENTIGAKWVLLKVLGAILRNKGMNRCIQKYTKHKRVEKEAIIDNQTNGKLKNNESNVSGRQNP